MSLEIDVEKISEVLLADGWHKVSPVGDGRSSFGLDVYEFQQSPTQELPGPQPHAGQPTKAGQEHGSWRSGARWTEVGWLSGVLSGDVDFGGEVSRPAEDGKLN